MKRQKVIISLKARASLRQHLKYLKEEVSPEVAERVRVGIINKCKELKNFSGYSKDPYLEDEPHDYRSVSIWNYLIIYRVSEKEVRVLNIVHTSRHPDTRKDI